MMRWNYLICKVLGHKWGAIHYAKDDPDETADYDVKQCTRCFECHSYLDGDHIGCGRQTFLKQWRWTADNEGIV